MGVTVTRQGTNPQSEVWDVRWTAPGAVSTWSLGGGGTFSGNPTAPQLGGRNGERMTEMEAAIVYSLSPYRQAQIIRNRQLAIDRTQQLAGICGSQINGNGNANAFQHAYWTALNVQSFGPELAYRLVSAHEAFGENTNVEADMDHFNDSVGLTIGRYYPTMPEDQLADTVLRWIQTGHGRRFFSGGMTATDTEICN